MNSWQHRNVDTSAPKWPTYFVFVLLCCTVIVFALYIRHLNIKPTNSDSAAKAAVKAWNNK